MRPFIPDAAHVPVVGHAGFGGQCGAFLAHKLAYAALLADYGRVADATRYCGAVQATLAGLPKLPPGSLVAAAQAKDLAARLEAHASVRQGLER